MCVILLFHGVLGFGDLTQTGWGTQRCFCSTRTRLASLRRSRGGLAESITELHVSQGEGQLRKTASREPGVLRNGGRGSPFSGKTACTCGPGPVAGRGRRWKQPAGGLLVGGALHAVLERPGVPFPVAASLSKLDLWGWSLKLRGSLLSICGRQALPEEQLWRSALR